MTFLGRLLVEAAPKIVYTATEPCLLEFWVSTDQIEDVDPTTVYIAWDKALCTRAAGTPLEGGTRFEVSMGQGDELYAVTKNLAQMGYMVK